MPKFRPCIDLHAGQVKQIVGSTLSTTDADEKNLETNFTSTLPVTHYSTKYATDQLTGGHVIMLGPGNTDAAKQALQNCPLQVGGGVTAANCQEWLTAGATHVIVTSAVFEGPTFSWNKLQEIVDQTGKERLVLDLSCRRKKNNTADNEYYVVTNKWQTYTDLAVTPATLSKLADYCDEFLVHGVDVEGKQCGILTDLVELLGHHSPIPVTYAGGVRSIDDLERVAQAGKGKVDVTVGSALDIFGGTLPYDDVVAWHRKYNPLDDDKSWSKS